MVKELTEGTVDTLRDAAARLTGADRRAFEAQVCLDYLYGDARLTEKVFGWSRHTVNRGLKELRTGQVIPDKPRAYKPKTEDARPQLARDIRHLVEPDSQTDPKFQTAFQYTRLTAKAVHEKLITLKGYARDDLPCENTIGVMLNRMGFKLRSVRKAKPEKKFPRRMRSSTTSTP